ncbi:sugar ABC transporter permease [Mesorhizobium sp.]|uniref:carbohydrate ABC transporter permease n=1 Tax=Mesorhizobium sp. TaxID=1871066 RepID=UPI00120A9325|nr:sugar ABC transporter permease [Mesorhizobium sp.]TIO08459.1 MAG: sugar ABC transporter permease [Mesorhizobium sp.]TIO33893.1 MAG: sugar ABC transporter permease [Mesorhizobium sp.]
MFDKKHIPHLLMVFPFLALFAVFFLYPIVSGFVYSFYDWNATTTSRFVGLANYQRIVHSRDFSKAMWNLGSYIIITVPVGIAVAFCLALLVDSFKGFWQNFFRSIFFMPVVLPMFLAATIWRWIYTPNIGLLNTTRGFFGLPSVQFLNDTSTMLYSLIAVDVWVSAGFNMVIILAGMKNIPRQYYEAARLDGASKLQEIFYITIPMLYPVLFFVTTYGVISALQVFDTPWLLTGSSFSQYGGRQNALLFPVMDMMGRGFGELKFGQAAAYGFILTTVIVSVTAVMFALRKKGHQP